MNESTLKVLYYINDHPKCNLDEVVVETHLSKRYSRQTLRLFLHRKWIKVDENQAISITPFGIYYLSENLNN